MFTTLFIVILKYQISHILVNTIFLQFDEFVK